jgi:hypothetical protein
LVVEKVHSVSLCKAYLALQEKPSFTSVYALVGGSIALSILTTFQQTLSQKSDSGRRDAFTAQALRKIQYQANQNDKDMLYVVKIYWNLVI